MGKFARILTESYQEFTSCQEYSMHNGRSDGRRQHSFRLISQVPEQAKRRKNMRTYLYCPYCGGKLAQNGQNLAHCEGCRFTQYDNPTPVAAALIPYQGGIVLVRRKVEPCKGEWCLPCGYINRFEDFEYGFSREVFEETGLVVCLQRIVWAYNPASDLYAQKDRERANQLVIHGLGRWLAGELRAGDDALEVGVFTHNTLPAVCFSSHEVTIRQWFKNACEIPRELCV